MKRILKYIIPFTATILLLPALSFAQMPDFSNRYIRVAETGQLADSISVWGDVNSAGRYLVPEGTNLPELISYCFGYTALRGRESDINWSKTQMEVKVSRYNKSQKLVDVALFKYKFQDPEPAEMFEFDLRNNDIVTIQVRRKPAFTDYVNVVAPVVGVIATSILLVQNLTGN
ncbi:MAG: hypothetical protein PVH63_04365 [Balneolaceae bacterium]|jgi:hypothetical protein